MELNDFQKACLETSDFRDKEAQEISEKLNLSGDYIDYGNLPSEISSCVSDAKNYIDKAEKTFALFYVISGLTGEAGEVSEKIKKLYRNQGGRFAFDYEKEQNRKLITKEDVMYEVADVLWYTMAALNELGYSAEEACEKLIAKLSERKEQNKIKSSGDDINER